MNAAVQVELGNRSYPILIGQRLLASPSSYGFLGSRPRRIVTDNHVAPLYLARLGAALGVTPEAVPAPATVLPAGEASKQMDTVAHLLDELMAARFPRDGVLVALGGGVVGDITGFVAAIYQRGIHFVQVPTTLLAQVDSSVGGKTGVNHRLGKNMIGAFHQPDAVIADTDTLSTLPPREFAAGMAEVVKYGLLGDAAFLAWLEQHAARLKTLDAGPLADAIRRCCEMKAAVVARDEREAGQRALLNLGHTFAHAIETWSGYGAWLHGEAVAVGLCMAADLSARMGWIDGAEVARVQGLLTLLDLPTRPPEGMRPADFHALMAHDKKVRSGRLRLILLRAIGRAVVTEDFDRAALGATLESFCANRVAAT
ncbi:MAG TPA: 3-dehydroquinate synthase [Nevskiaceae bacterium]